MNKGNLPKSDPPNNLQKHQVAIATQYTGPIPPPTALREYDAILPGAAERIMTLAEAEAKHRHTMDVEGARQNDTVIEKSFDERKRGQWFGLIIGSLALVTAIIALLNNHPTVAGVIGGTAAVGLVSAFLVGRLRRKDKQPPA